MKSLWSLPWFPSRFAGGLGVLETPGLEDQDCSFGGCHAPTRPGWGTTDVAFFCDAYEVVPQWAKSLSWLITPITMVYGRYIDILTMVYKPTYNWGAQPCNHVKWENCGTIMGEVWDNMGWLWMIAELNLAWQGFSFLGWDNRMLMGIVMRLINQQ